MNKKILPENIQISEYNNLKKQESFLDNMEIFKSNKRDIRFFTAITLPLILAACGGGGGGGAVSPTPERDQADQAQADQAQVARVAQVDQAQVDQLLVLKLMLAIILLQVEQIIMFMMLHFLEVRNNGDDGNVIITDFDPANDTITLRGSGAPSLLHLEAHQMLMWRQTMMAILLLL